MASDRSDGLQGAAVHDFSVSGTLSGRFALITFIVDGAAITEVKENNDPANVLSKFTNNGAVKAGATFAADKPGGFIHEVSGTSGQVNYVNA